MGWPFLSLLYPSSWTLTGCKGHLCACLVIHLFFFFYALKKNDNQTPLWEELPKLSGSKFVSGWSRLKSLLGLLEVIGIQHPACPVIHLLFGFLSLNMGFMDSLAMDHSILCLKLIALWSSKGKIPALLKAVSLTWASLPWVSSEGNLTGSSPGKAKPLHLSLCWKLPFMLSGRL